MTRRGDPERIYQAQRAGVFIRLIQMERIDELDAEQWIVRWERKSEEIGRPRGSVGYWDGGRRWIAGERAASRPPNRAHDGH